MKQTFSLRRRGLALLLCAAMLVTLLPVALTSAAPLPILTGAVATVEIEQADTVAEIQSRIQTALDINGTLIVTGSKTDADETLALTIPDIAWLIWNAEYAGGAEEAGGTFSGDGLVV
ncbi:MAG: hypothetical protein FWE69_08075, partial [Clostridiales bacterium]|nr:hypothetical protein [Clostridiales bacterium]